MSSLVFNSTIRITTMPPKTTNAHLKRNVGAIIHACAHFAISERTAKKYYGNKRWNSYYLRGVVVSSNDGRKKPDDRAKWTLNVNFDIVEMDGTLREVTNRNILANNCQSGEIPTLRWYGVGGEWINIGIPHYVAMERKPDNEDTGETELVAMTFLDSNRRDFVS